MTARSLHLAKDLSLPLDAVSRTFGILAVRGAGKSNTAAVMAEEMFAAQLPFCVVDPVGSWYGLRSSADGKTPGLPIPIFGGKHGDVPLERGAGELIADLVVEKRLTCVLDLSRFNSEGDKKAFLLAFAQRLYLKNEDPLHLFLEEADDYIPQKPMRDEAYLLRAWENIVRRGRSRGLGMTLITQRSAAVNKMVLTQVETLIAMRTTGPQDIAAIAAWVQYHDVQKDLLASLSGLEDGEAWVWSPHFLKIISRHQIRRRATFDSGATPKNVHAKDTRPPATLADIDLGLLQARMAATIEKAKADDPRELRKQIADLKKQVAKGANVITPPETATSVAVLTDADRALLEGLNARLTSFRDAVGVRQVTLFDAFKASLIETLADFSAALQLASDRARLEFEARLDTKGFQKILGKLSSVQAPAPTPRQPQEGLSHRVAPRAATSRPVAQAESNNGHVGAAQRAFLTALAHRGGKPTTRNQLAVFTGYSAKSSHVDNVLSSLRTAGWATGSREALLITEAGMTALGRYEPLPTGDALVAHWVREAGAAAGAMLTILVRAYPKTMTRDQVAEATGYSVESSHVDNSISRLRTLQLVTGGRQDLCASEELFS